ncbi:starch-binding domain-like protein [Exidia glandulosa HHB12029]|uniref:Starch-binding domain-like protein n=1 Tax=Exidia glandulosa HHB12029 TaxID=1314781 RepID=A0A165DMT0_EXIGL|nr:starch-binding domain-like protein [Exidia glandulosa HHB12029]
MSTDAQNPTPELELVPNGSAVPATPKPPVEVTFEIAGHALTQWGNHIYVVGNIPELGEWDPARAVRLLPAQYPVWAGSVALPSSTPVSYKYICKAPGQAVVWEEPPYKNREAVTPDADQERGTIRDAWY